MKRRTFTTMFGALFAPVLPKSQASESVVDYNNRKPDIPLLNMEDVDLSWFINLQLRTMGDRNRTHALNAQECFVRDLEPVINKYIEKYTNSKTTSGEYYSSQMANSVDMLLKDCRNGRRDLLQKTVNIFAQGIIKQIRDNNITENSKILIYSDCSMHRSQRFGMYGWVEYK
jgi:hypothetical protein